MPLFTTACPRNCYSTCSLQVEVEEGRLRRIEPHPGNRDTGQGVCLKGLSYLERSISPGRLLHPLRRQSDGSFSRISQDEALDEICRVLQRIRSEYGPGSVFYYAGSGTKGLLNSLGMEFWRFFGGCTTTYGDLCWPAGLEATRLTLGTNLHNAPRDLANARLIVLWGKNAAETNVHQMHHINQSLDRGGRLIVIDPRRTESAERAELLLQPRPGTDGALALAVCRELIRGGAMSQPFIEAHVFGFPEFRTAVEVCTPEWAEEITGIPAADILRLAGAFASTRPFTIVAGFGMQRYSNSGQTMRAMLAIPAITGQFGKSGAGWMYANLQTAIFSAVKDPVAFFPPEVPDGVVRVSVSTARLGRDMLVQSGPPLRFAWVERGNPVPQNPETGTVIQAFRQLDFRVVVEEFLTDTAREADIILPAKNLFEQTDVIGAYWHPYIQIKQKIMEPPGEVLPESEIYRRLALRLGGAPEQIARLFPGPSDEDIEAWLARKLEPFPGLTLEKLRQGPVEAPGSVEIAFADGKFPTPSGKIELYSEEAVRRWGTDPLPVYRDPVISPRRQPELARQYPLQFMTPNTKNRIHSQFNNLDTIRQFSPRPCLAIGPEEAARRGIGDGDPVRVFNRRGELRLEARLDFGMPAGCVAVTNGWWLPEGGAVNLLSEGRETDMAYGAAFHDTLVEVEKVNP